MSMRRREFLGTIAGGLGGAATIGATAEQTSDTNGETSDAVRPIASGDRPRIVETARVRRE
jgi:hypothetical protein